MSIIVVARFVKLLHELGSIGTLGSVAVCLLLLAPRAARATAAFAASCDSVWMIVHWVLVPSFVAVILSGLLALVATPPYMDRGWAWLKALLSLSLFEASLMLSSTSREAATLSHQAAAGNDVLPQLAQTLRTEVGVLWVLFGVSVVNVVLGIWRPRLMRSKSIS